MKKYEKPVVLENEELAEGVYAASGALVGSDCYTVIWNTHQKPQIGRGDYRTQFTATHNATDGHHSGEQTLIITFNQNVVYKESGGTLLQGDGTNVIQIVYPYHNNATDNIGLGDVVVESDQGLTVTGAVLICNGGCDQH